MRVYRWILACVLLAVPASGAQAGYRFEFDQGSYNVLTTQTVDIQVFLVGTGTDAASLRTIGLEAYGVQLNYSATAGAKVLSASDIINNPAFDGGAITSATGTSAVANGSVNFGPTTFVRDTVTTSGNSRILLATFRFTGLTAGSALVVTADPNPGLGEANANNFLAGGTAIDDMLFASPPATATINVAQVPEPGTMALTGLLATGIAGAAVRRVRRKPAAV